MGIIIYFLRVIFRIREKENHGLKKIIKFNKMIDLNK